MGCGLLGRGVDVSSLIMLEVRCDGNQAKPLSPTLAAKSRLPKRTTVAPVEPLWGAVFGVMNIPCQRGGRRS